VRRPIDIEGTFAITGPGLAATFRGVGREVVCDLAGLSMGWSLVRRARQAGVFCLPIQSMLERADVRISIRLGGRVIAEAGPGIMTGRIASLFGLTGMRFRLFKSPGALPRTTSRR
jgi:hypothetical protein